MTLIFQPSAAGHSVRQELDGKKKTIGAFIPGPEDGDWIFQPKSGIILADAAMETVEEKFIAYLERQNASTAVEEPGEATEPIQSRPDPDPEQGTAGIEFMTWAGTHMADDEFKALYESRWARKAFRAGVENLVEFSTRCTNSFPPDCI